MYAKFNKDHDRWMFAFDKADDSWVEYPDEKHEALFQAIQDALPEAKEIGTGKDGLPEVVDPAPLNSEQAWAVTKVRAQEALNESDRVVLRHYEDSEPVPAEWIAYRKSLRAIISASTGDSTKALPVVPSN